MAFQSQTFANSNTPYYGSPADWSNYSTLTSTISFDNTNAKLKAIPVVPDSNTTLTWNGNQLAYLSDIPDPGDWAQYPANHDVDIPAPYILKADTAFISTLTVYQQTTVNSVTVSSFITSTLQVIDTLTASKLTNSTITILADNQNFPLQLPSLNITSKNGLGGRVTVTADSGSGFVGGGLITLDAKGGTGLLGQNGAVNIVADSGSSAVVGVTTGGRIDITAESGINDLSLTSAIKLSAAGINIQSGVTSPITSVLGYTFIGGNLGVNSCAGIPPIIPNVPGSNYIYGLNGIVLDGDVYTSDVYPKWDGISNPDDLILHGRTVNVGLGSYNAMVEMENVSKIAFETVGARKGGAITGLSSINGLNSGPVGAIQYSNGAGSFQGNSGLKYNGISRIENTTGLNFIDINEAANNNGVSIQSFAEQVNITAGDILGLTSLDRVYITSQAGMVVNISSTPGSQGQVLTSDGTFTEWKDLPVSQAYQATYYKSVSQNLVNANTDITFDLTGAWNNSGGFITHTDGTSAFTVAIAGLYFLEFNASINANGATWNNGVNKSISIDITRIGIAEQAVISNSALSAISVSYSQSVSASFYLQIGDIINFRTTLAFATATPFVIGVLNTFDLNTFASWRYIQ